MLLLLVQKSLSKNVPKNQYCYYYHYYSGQKVTTRTTTLSSSSSCSNNNNNNINNKNECRRFIGGGGIGRMLDMGGMPSAMNDTTPYRAANASKNSKLQAVAFDFDVLTRSIDSYSSPTSEQQQQQQNTSSSSSSLSNLGKVQPDLDQIQNVASLLNVDLKTDINNNNRKTTTTTTTTTTKLDDKNFSKLLPNQDIRAKYASKLKGGVAGLELAKSQIQEKLKTGDAAGHLAVRKKAISETAATPTKWMAMTGTGKLLSYLTHRCIRIALLPNPKLQKEQKEQGNNNKMEHEYQSMQQFSKQLKDVVIDLVVQQQQDENEDKVSPKMILQKGVLKELLENDNIHPNRILIVSDKDEYLQAARDLEMMTCRIRPLNARRGNVTTHFSVPSVPHVQEVINEINGISFNAVLNR